MSEELAEKRKQEEEALTKQEEEDAKELEGDRCPHCLRPTSSYPYYAAWPILGWLECASCGVVFSPLSTRKLKIKRAQSSIIVPK